MLTAFSGEATLELIDIYGKVIFKENNTKQNYTFDLSKYTKGIYLLKITNNSNTTVHKIVYQ